jgi:MFS family permease
MLLLSLLSYMDRSVLAILSPTILHDLHLSVTQYGYAVSVFSLCYMLANPIWGYWIDRRGLWVSVLVAVSVWSLASGSHALMLGLGGMCLARGLLGFGEGAPFLLDSPPSPRPSRRNAAPSASALPIAEALSVQPSPLSSSRPSPSTTVGAPRSC